MNDDEVTLVVAMAQASDLSGEPPGTRTQGPRLKSSNRQFLISARYCVWFPQNVYFRSVKSVLLLPIFSISSNCFSFFLTQNWHSPTRRTEIKPLISTQSYLGEVCSSPPFLKWHVVRLLALGGVEIFRNYGICFLHEVLMNTVVLVDDYPEMRQLLRDILERYPDMQIVGEAASGEEAVTLAGHTDRIRCVFCRSSTSF
jgi:hypothetical protein